ncbi:neoverrucotoxin subunit beta-like [Fundulus diaphanus]
MDPEKIIEVATLGRPFSVGMLYDRRQDTVIPGLTLWDRDDLEKDKRENPKPNSDFEIVASESIDGKSSALDVEASLKASFLGGLVKVEGSAKYLNDQMTSKNQARVTLKYKTTTKFQELSMNHLGRGNVKHPYVLENKIATHVVTGILFGAQAFFVFEQEISETESHQDIQGNLKLLIEKIPCLSTGGAGPLKLEDQDTEKINKFTCKFHGDFLLEKTPTTFKDAVEVYQSLPRLLGTSGENAVPIKVWLLPLTYLDSAAAKLVCEISLGLVQEVQSVLEELSELDIRCNDAMRDITTQQFPQIGKKLKSFKNMCSEFRLGFQQTLAKKLPSIRGGGEEESELADILEKRHSSPFNSKNLNEWMDCKEREIFILKSFTRMMKNTKIVLSQNSLYEDILNAEHALCFVFTSLEHDEPFLSALSNYLKGRTKTDDSDIYDFVKVQWYLSNTLVDEMRTKVKIFSDFAEANNDNKSTTFLTVGLTDDNHEGSTIYLYKDGLPVSKNFEPPSKPKRVTAADINHTSVILHICPPSFGAKNVTSYSVEYCVRGEDEWKQTIEPKSAEITVNQLKPNTEYLFRCRAMASAGIGPANKINDPIKTLPCSPPGECQVEPNSSEISLSWEKPAELGPDVQILSYIVEYASTANSSEVKVSL